MKCLPIFSLLFVSIVALAACEPDAQKASNNLSKAADMFEIQRRIVFYNGITDRYILMVEGRCSLLDDGRKLSVTCKLSDTEFFKHYLGLSDNVTYFAEQLEMADVSVYHNRVVFKPQSIIPDIDIEGDAGEIIKNRN